MMDPDQRSKRHHPLAKAGLGLAGLGLMAGLGLAAGFGIFLWGVSHAEAPADPRADGIVVLTGGVARVESGLQLLREGRAERLLISGVDRKVSRSALRRSVEAAGRPAFDCCVDVDHALDTMGNATEARRWAQSRGYKSLIVVTSDYHMPRSLALMGATMPGVRLIPYPIGESEGGDKAATARPVRLLLGEFLKYLAVRMRNAVESPASPDVRVATSSDAQRLSNAGRSPDALGSSDP